MIINLFIDLCMYYILHVHIHICIYYANPEYREPSTEPAAGCGESGGATSGSDSADSLGGPEMYARKNSKPQGLEYMLKHELLKTNHTSKIMPSAPALHRLVLLDGDLSCGARAHDESLVERRGCPTHFRQTRIVGAR